MSSPGNCSGPLAACGGSPWFGVDGGVGGPGPHTPPSTPNQGEPPQAARGPEQLPGELMRTRMLPETYVACVIPDKRTVKIFADGTEERPILDLNYRIMIWYDVLPWP